MLRSELLSAARRVRRAIRQPSMLTLFRLPDQQITLEQMLEAFRDWVKMETTFGTPEQRILDCLDLVELTRTSYWHQLLAGLATRAPDPPSGMSLAKLRTTLRAADLKIPKLVALFQQGQEAAEAAASTAPVPPTITLFLLEQADQTSTVLRIIESLQGIANLYEALAVLGGLPESTLAILECDGADCKSFELTGAPQIIEELKSLILTIWSRVIFFKEWHGEKTKLIANSLPILDDLKELTNQSKVSPELGLKLRNLIIAGATKFIDSGSNIPEIKENSNFDPAALLMASPRLVVEQPRAFAEAVTAAIDDAAERAVDVEDEAVPAVDVGRAESRGRPRANLNGAAANVAETGTQASVEA
jgi:hypothetical protein